MCGRSCVNFVKDEKPSFESSSSSANDGHSKAGSGFYPRTLAELEPIGCPVERPSHAGQSARVDLTARCDAKDTSEFLPGCYHFLSLGACPSCGGFCCFSSLIDV